MTVESMEFEPRHQSGSRWSGRRIAAITGAAMLVTAAGGIGYGLGQRAGDDGGSAAPVATIAEDVADPFDGGAGDPPETTTLPTTTGPPAEASVETAPADGAAPREEPLTAAESDDSGQASGGQGYPAFGARPMQTLFERTTADGFTLRAQLGETWDNGGDWGVPGWAPAPWCYESGQLRVAMSGDGVIDVGGVGWYSEPFAGRALSWLSLGGADARPHWIVVAQTTPDITGVTARFSDGATDSVAPQNGIAVLIVPGQPAREVQEYDYSYWIQDPPEFTVSFDGGPEPVTVDADGVSTWEDPEFRASCEPPPPALPEPGEQPADPASAEAQIIEAMRALYDPPADLDVDDALVDDPTGIADARAQVAEGGFESEAASAQATIEELVFTTPTEAWFRYRIETSGIDLFDRFGIAVDVDGVWKITRSTICQDLSMAGGDCGDDWQFIQPPSVTDRPDEIVTLDD